MAELINRYDKPVIFAIPERHTEDRWKFLVDFLWEQGIPCVVHASQGARAVNELMLSPIKERILPALRMLAAEENTTREELLLRYMKAMDSKKGPNANIVTQAVNRIIRWGFDRLTDVGMPTLQETGLNPLSKKDKPATRFVANADDPNG